MYLVKLFNAPTTALLQHDINDWLQLNKDILIHSASLSVGETTVPGGYCFYILYSGPDVQDAALKEMAAAVTHQQSIEVKEMNPEILKPSS
jgi:hypothetical protein